MSAEQSSDAFVFMGIGLLGNDLDFGLIGQSLQLAPSYTHKNCHCGESDIWAYRLPGKYVWDLDELIDDFHIFLKEISHNLTEVSKRFKAWIRVYIAVGYGDKVGFVLPWQFLNTINSIGADIAVKFFFRDAPMPAIAEHLSAYVFKPVNHSFRYSETIAYTGLSLSGDDLDMNAITNALKVTPAKTKKKKDFPKIARDFWNFYSPKERMERLGNASDLLVSSFTKSENMLLRLKHEYGIYSKIYIVIELLAHATEVHLSRNFIAFAGAIETDIEIDQYFG